MATKQSILKYTSEIWNTADLLIASGIKQSDFPKYMMPFFGLILLESRMLRAVKQLLKEEFDVEKLEDLKPSDLQDFKEEFLYQDIGFNEFIVVKGKTLKAIVKNDKTFQQDFDAYLNGFDSATKDVLGVGKPNNKTKYLNITGVSGELADKSILFSTVKEWSKIDLTPFDNSDITSLEEHIKFKWADISADTAGEQYTPKDVIQLMSDIVVERIQFAKSEFITVYDPTCGGGNLLFGVADDLDQTHGYKIKTYGQDWNDVLYSLAWIESRFRKDAEIEYDNTLVDTKYINHRFHVIVANPPHGIPWKGYSKDIYKDETGRFKSLPSTSDGQLLFAQHILHHLHDEGIAVVVHNGSALFSGDAGGGESDIRKHFFDNDWVEAIIQLPTDEFFNTGIHTYIWLFNKNKPKSRKNKVMLVDASSLFKQLKKSFGKKRREIDKESRKKITTTLNEFKDNDFAKVFERDYFYYNKQAVQLTNLDENGQSLEEHLPVNTNKRTGEVKRATAIKLNIPQSIFFQKITWRSEELVRENISKDEYNEIKEFLKTVDYKEQDIKIETEKAIYHYDNEQMTIIETTEEGETALGNGKILIKPTYKKATKTKPSSLTIKVELQPDYQKDYEVIPFSHDTEKNDQLIDDFLEKYIFKPYIKLDSRTGLEINFNKVFYQPEPLRPIEDIKTDIAELDKQLTALEKELDL